MQEQSSTPRSDRFKVYITIAVVLLAAATIWIAFQPDKATAPSADNSTGANTTSSEDKVLAYIPVESGKKGFSLRVPEGWGPLYRSRDSNLLLLAGTKQPVVSGGAKVDIKTLDAFGSDGPLVFFADLSDMSGAQPQGEVTPFTIGKGDESLTGKKYSYYYTQDDMVGIGIQRYIGDRTYEYVFPVGDKELHVVYEVYGDDPRNQMTLVDDIVRSITVR